MHSQQITYLVDNNGRKYHSDAEKCDTMKKKTLEEIFRITPLEEAAFDRENTVYVNNYLQMN